MWLKLLYETSFSLGFLKKKFCPQPFADIPQVSANFIFFSISKTFLFFEVLSFRGHKFKYFWDQMSSLTKFLFFRQVIACTTDPSLLKTNLYPEDVKQKALSLLGACGGGSVGL